MPSDIQVTNIKANDGTAGLVIADSTGRITVTETNPVVTLGSNATFPAGHVVQTVVAIKSDEDSVGKTGTSFSKVVDSGGNAEWTAQIDNVTDGNDIIISASFTARLGVDADQKGGQFGFLRDTSASNSGGTIIYEFDANHGWYIDGRGAWGGGTGDLVMYNYIHLMYVDTDPGSGTFCYYLGSCMQAADSTNITARSNSSTSHPFTMTVQEIQR